MAAVVGLRLARGGSILSRGHYLFNVEFILRGRRLLDGFDVERLADQLVVLIHHDDRTALAF